MNCESVPALIQCHLGSGFNLQYSFKMPKLCVVKSDKVKKIPCKNPHKYSDCVDPIYEIHKVSRGELTELSCQASHL